MRKKDDGCSTFGCLGIGLLIGFIALAQEVPQAAAAIVGIIVVIIIIAIIYNRHYIQ
ncbi:hypothetical protein [Dysgonomonas sp. 520]|uniref:hypothetical protein n=1 Tax=Dysgonomonas sp. 520 TaxID=2302931 RepID=UPI0013D580CA|nr:hypothetical protein [Dysgonomonas sp. 520]